MSFQNVPSKSGVYRIRAFREPLYFESIPQAGTRPPWIRLSADSGSEQHQWLLVRSSSAPNEWTIFSMLDNAGLLYVKHENQYQGHGYPSPIPRRLPINWKITDYGTYSKISTPVNGTDVFDARFRAEGDDAVHLWQPLDANDFSQRFVFEFVEEDDYFPTKIMRAALPRRATIPLIRAGDTDALVFGDSKDDDELPDLANIQGDIIYHFPKRAETFIFFRISPDIASFRTALRTFQVSNSKNTGGFVYQIAERRIGGSTQTMERVGSQIAFTRMGMNFLGVRGATGDARFDTHAMRDDKDMLGDQAQWDAVFDKTNPDPKDGSVKQDAGALHGVISIAASGPEVCRKAVEATQELFGASIEVISTIQGRERPKPNRGNEHFGYKDGTSQSALRNLIDPKPGQTQVDPGVILMGYKGDPVLDNPDMTPRPAWTKGGTIMVFRKLEQDVDAFNKYLKKNGPRWREFAPPGCPRLSDEEGADLWGARLVGRWKSGAPLALCPYKDDPQLAADPLRNNDFDYRVRNVAAVSPRQHTDRFCPFFAHIRKTVPRDLDPFVQRSYLESSMIVRAGLPYGPEFEENPRAERGLLFVCYQSDLDQGFVRQTTGFANNDYFPTTSLRPQNHGQAPIIGGPPSNSSSAAITEAAYVRPPQVPPRSGDPVNLTLGLNGGTIEVSGFAKVKDRGVADAPGVPQEFFVTSHGGEYFFVPPISTLGLWAQDVPNSADPGTEGMLEQAQEAVSDFLKRFGVNPDGPYPAPPPLYTPPRELANLPVGIIGAGASGLYIGMMLDSLGIKYEIMEGSGRIGGRLYTYRFPKKAGKYQYFDVGAMRYPNTSFMNRTFELVDTKLEMLDVFIPYIRNNDKTFLCYNDVTVRREAEDRNPKSDDVFRLSAINGGNVPQQYIEQGADAVWADALKDLRQNFVSMGFRDAYDKLMEYDSYSVAAYLQHVKKLPADVINWLQTRQSRTGQMDEALSETVLASLVFNDPRFPKQSMEWFCLDGGSEVIPRAMAEKLSVQPVHVEEKMIRDELEDYFPWDFGRDSFQLGAFCQFGPSQFKYMYPHMLQPAGTKQRLHFAGDATSVFHGWVAGALNSAWRAVMGMLIAHPELNPKKNEDIVAKFRDIWGENEELDQDRFAAVVNVGRRPVSRV